MKTAADEILALNQDAMVLKSTRLRRQSEWVETAVVRGVLAALVLGLLASAALTSRALRPVAVLGQSVRRLGQGDYAARVRVPEGGGSEIAQLASDFNAMAESLQRYRDSSLGELLEAQLAAQATIDSLPDPVVVFDVTGKVANANRAAEQLLGIRARTDTSPRRRPRSGSGWSGSGTRCWPAPPRCSRAGSRTRCWSSRATGTGRCSPGPIRSPATRASCSGSRCSCRTSPGSGASTS